MKLEATQLKIKKEYEVPKSEETALDQSTGGVTLVIN